jgi:hypothetical protein
MVWERRVRKASWIFFWLMLASVFWYMAVSEDPESVSDPKIIPFFAFFGLFIVLQIGSIYVDRYEKEIIRTKGIPATATVISYKSTGTLYFNQPELRIELEVQPPWGPRFVTTVNHVVAYHDLKRIEPGTRVRVHYLEDTHQVAIDGLDH